MESRELRIGNLVQTKRCDGVFITDHVERLYLINGEDTIRTAKGWSFEHKPIPLTEEWLLKFGFNILHKKNKHYFIQNPKGVCRSHKIHVFKTIGDKWHLAFSDDTTSKDYLPPCHFKYVHQLQGLYYALTGEELEIK